MGRIRLHVIVDCTRDSLETFIDDNVAAGSTVATDSWRGYNFIDQGSKWRRDKSLQARSRHNPKLYGVHLVASLLKRLIRSTFQGRFEPKYLQNYLDEYVFRFNRRKSKSVGKIFMRLVQQAVKSCKITYPQISWDLDPISGYVAT
jgi:hypothetical protein